MSNKKISIIFLLISIALVLLSTFAPSIMEDFIHNYNDDFRITVRICGILLSAWGIAFLFKQEK